MRGDWGGSNENAFIFLESSPLVCAGFCSFATQNSARRNRHATQATTIQYCPGVGDILVTVQWRKEAKREPGYLFAICGRKRGQILTS